MTIPPFNTYLGVEVRRMEGGEAIAEQVGPHHRNSNGVGQGAVLKAGGSGAAR
jgi:hypothetical protein